MHTFEPFLWTCMLWHDRRGNIIMGSHSVGFQSLPFSCFSKFHRLMTRRKRKREREREREMSKWSFSSGVESLQNEKSIEGWDRRKVYERPGWTWNPIQHDIWKEEKTWKIHPGITMWRDPVPLPPSFLSKIHLPSHALVILNSFIHKINLLLKVIFISPFFFFSFKRN